MLAASIYYLNKLYGEVSTKCIYNRKSTRCGKKKLYFAHQIVSNASKLFSDCFTPCSTVYIDFHSLKVIY